MPDEWPTLLGWNVIGFLVFLLPLCLTTALITWHHAVTGKALREYLHEVRKARAKVDVCDLVQRSDIMFTGRVDDLDFIANLDWCQVILRNEQGNQLAAVTKDHRMQTLLELAFATGKFAEVSFKDDNPKVLTRVKVNREVPP